MADDLRVAIRLNVDGKQAVGELKIARAELAGLSAEAKRSGLSSGLKDSAGHARNLAAGMASVSRETVAANSAASSFAAGLKGIGPAIGVAFAIGAITNFARAVGQAAIQLQKTQATLAFASGSAVEAAKAYEFASQEAQRLGLEVQSTALQYAKFSASAKGTALSAAEVKTVFTGVTEASRALGLSTGETENAIRALVQMLSKGKITAEEFRGQLGDALPGATRIAAKALGVTTEEFSRMLDEGELTLDFVAKFGDALHQEFGVTATQAAKGLAAELNRLSNAWNDVLIAVGETGAISAATEVMGFFALSIAQAADAIENFQKQGLANLLERGGRVSVEDFESVMGPQPVSRPRGNQVPGGASAVQRPQANERDVFDDARAQKAQRALEALGKSEEAAQKASLARARELAKEEEKNHQAALRSTIELAKAREDAWKERAQAENEFARLQNQGLDHTEDLIAQEAQAWEKLDNQRADAIQEQQRLEERAADERTRILEREAEQQSRLMLAPFENAIEGIQGSFTDAFQSIFSGGVDTFAELAGTIKSIFIRLAAEIAALLVFRPIVSGILGAVGLGGVSGALGLGGGGAGAAGVGGGSILDLLSGGSSLSSLFGGPSLSGLLTGGINSFGQSLGFGLGPSFVGPLQSGAGTLTSASLSSILGYGAAGVGIGGLISSLLGGNSTIGSIAGGIGGVAGGIGGSALVGAGGALAGAAYGSVVPVIGTIIGAILGGLLGSAFKETPPRGHTVHEVGGGTIREFGKKGFDPASFDPLTKGIDKAIVELGKLLKINTEGARYFIGFDQEKGFSAHPDVYSKDAKALTRTIVLEELSALAETPFQKNVLRRAYEEPTLKGSLESIGSDVSFKKEFEKFVKEAGKPPNIVKEAARAAAEIRAMEREFKKMKEQAIELGLSLAGFKQATKRVKDEVKKPFKDQIESVIDFGKPRDLGDELAELEKGFSELRKAAKKLGLSLEGFDEGAKKAKEALIDTFKDELDRRVGGEPPDLQTQLKELEEWFDLNLLNARQAGIPAHEFAKLEEEARENLIKGFKDQFEAFKNFGKPRDLGDELRKLEEEFAEMRQTAKELGLSLDGFDAAAQRARDAFITDQRVSAVGQIRSNLDALGITSLRAFRNQLDVAPDVAPIERLGNAMRQLEEARAQALGGDIDAIRSLPELAQRALELHREVYANSPETARFRDDLKALLDGLITNLTPAGLNWEDLMATMREVGAEQIAQLKLQTEILLQQLEALDRLRPHPLLTQVDPGPATTQQGRFRTAL